MWDGLFMLLVLGGVMALASFLAGSLPLSFSLSQRHIRLISAIGTGLLVGTALIVIIPEGIETLYSAETSAASVSNGGFPPQGGATTFALHEPLNPDADRLANANELVQNADPVAVRDVNGPEEASLHNRITRDDHGHEQTSSHAWIGISLITGFILMYLIDAVPDLSSSPRGQHIPLTTLNGDTPTTSKPLSPHSHSRSTTIGLVIHSFADGIALGASSTTPSSQNTLGLIVFVAILVHKAPAAFGLTSVLLKQGFSKRAARGHLFLFSLAAPIGALLTWAFANLLGKSSLSSRAPGSGVWWTGVILIFSGGTFLYVAMHAMQSVTAPQYSEPSLAHDGDYPDIDSPSPYSTTRPHKGKGLEITLMVTGMLLPLLTQIGHAHAHG